MNRFIARLDRLSRNRTYVLVFSLLLMSVVMTVASTILLARFSLLTQADRYIQDWQIASLLPAEPRDADVVVVAITEQTLEQFPYRSPVDRIFIADLLKTLASRHPRAIGVDILFDQPTQARSDVYLKQTLALLPIPLVAAYTDVPGIESARQNAYQDSYLPPRLRALPTLAEDQFGAARWVFPGAVEKGQGYIPGFARAVAAAAGVPSPAIWQPIAWHGRPSPDASAFAEYSAEFVRLLPAAWFRNKIVLIGSDVSLEDRHVTPFTVLSGSKMAGVTIQAHAVSQIVHRVSPPFIPWQIDFLIALYYAGLGGLFGVLGFPLSSRVTAAFLTVATLWVAGVTIFHYTGHMTGLVAPTLALVGNFTAMDSLAGREARRQRSFIQSAFSHYVSPKVVERLIKDPSTMSLEGERREMTYLFSDIEGFTSFSELMDEKELAPILNGYFDGTTEIVLRHGGMVDKFIGDAIFAIFNAPVDLPDHAECAVKCALEMDEWMEGYRTGLRARGLRLGVTRIGIHTGTAVVGNFGSKSRFSYTAQGDAVNVASRLESLNKHLGTRICVSRRTRKLCKTVPFRPVASVVLKGKSVPLEIFEPLRDGEKTPDFLRRYREAFAKLEDCSPEALAMFGELQREAPDDPCVSLHLQRLREGDRGVAMVMTEK